MQSQCLANKIANLIFLCLCIILNLPLCYSQVPLSFTHVSTIFLLAESLSLFIFYTHQIVNRNMLESGKDY